VSSGSETSSGTRRTAGCAAVNARISSVQPSGVSQRSHSALDAVSAMTRSRKASASTPAAISIATRRVGAIWLASAPMPTKTGIGEMIASARNAESAAVRRPATRPANSISHSRAAPAAIAVSPARRTSPRATGSARTTSRRPDSSSARCARTAASSPHAAATIDIVPPTRQAV
jgi:hypothetical protein